MFFVWKKLPVLFDQLLQPETSSVLRTGKNCLIYLCQGDGCWMKQHVDQLSLFRFGAGVSKSAFYVISDESNCFQHFNPSRWLSRWFISWVMMAFPSTFFLFILFSLQNIGHLNVDFHSWTCYSWGETFPNHFQGLVKDDNYITQSLFCSVVHPTIYPVGLLKTYIDSRDDHSPLSEQDVVGCVFLFLFAGWCRPNYACQAARNCCQEELLLIERVDHVALDGII